MDHLIYHFHSIENNNSGTSHQLNSTGVTEIKEPMHGPNKTMDN